LRWVWKGNKRTREIVKKHREDEYVFIIGQNEAESRALILFAKVGGEKL
jgi:hypothetical protein